MFFCLLCVFIQTNFTERLWDTWVNREDVFNRRIETEFMAEREAHGKLVAAVQAKLTNALRLTLSRISNDAEKKVAASHATPSPAIN